jgi:hypothetical protein
MNDAIPPVNLSSPQPANNPESNVQVAADVAAYDEHVVVVNSGKTALNVDKPEEADYVGPREVVDKDFTYPTHTDPQRYVDGHNHGIYLDDEMRRAGEIQRAKVEGREPNLENPPAVQGTPLLPTAVVKKSLPGDHVVDPDVTLEVAVGINEDNLVGYGDAAKAREVLGVDK